MPARGPAVGMALLVAALLINAGLALYNIREVAASVQWVSHTNEVLGKLESVLSSLVDAEPPSVATC
jgi:CHASE3 domain sensor protein